MLEVREQAAAFGHITLYDMPPMPECYFTHCESAIRQRRLFVKCLTAHFFQTDCLCTVNRRRFSPNFIASYSSFSEIGPFSSSHPVNTRSIFVDRPKYITRASRKWKWKSKGKWSWMHRKECGGKSTRMSAEHEEDCEEMVKLLFGKKETFIVNIHRRRSWAAYTDKCSIRHRISSDFLCFL